MVKVKGKNVKFTPSDYVTKDLTILQRKKKITKKATAAAEAARVALENERHKAETEIQLPETRQSNDAKPTKKGWRNKQRVLVFSTRGINFQGRHIMENIRRLLPHSKKESKMEKKDSLFEINEIAEMKNCNKCIFFESRRAGDLYMWLSNVPEGPSIKFLMENVNTMEELKFTGNCLKGSRAILSFDPTFETEPHLLLMKEMFVQIFGTPYHFPRSQPFIDHVFTFTYLDNRVWFRNFQIMEEDGSLVEIGPRFVLNPIRIFEGSFNGVTAWANPHFVTPAKYRSDLKKAIAGKYSNRIQQKIEYEQSRPKVSYKLDPSDEIFQVQPQESI